MFKFFKYASVLALALSTPAAVLAQDAPDSGPAAPTNVIYVESNNSTPGGNSVFAFKRKTDGSLTELNGSPFLTGGTGGSPSFDLGPFDSDQNIITGPHHHLLVAVNSGSNNITVFHILTDGSLVPVNGSPFPSFGFDPVSVGAKGGILAVVNKHQDPSNSTDQSLPNYTTFQVMEDGSLAHIADSTARVATGSSPSQALTSPIGPFLFGADFMGGLLQSFRILPGGRLAQNPPVAIPDSVYAGSSAPHFPLGLMAHPTRPILYAGLVTLNRLAVYAYNGDGDLQFVRTVPNSGMALCWVIINKNASRLYTANTGDDSISVYDLTNPLQPAEIQKVTLKGAGSAFQIALDNKDQYFYVVTQQSAATQPASSNALHVLKVGADGFLAEVPSSPTVLNVPPGDRPQGVIAF